MQVKRKFGVRGTAGATPAQSSTAKSQDLSSKVSNPRRTNSISSMADTDDGAISKAAPLALPKVLRPRISVATPTPGGQPITRYPSLSSHTRKTSSSSTLSSIAAAQAASAPTRPPGLRRPESSSDAESVSSAAGPPKRLVRPLPHSKASAGGSSMGPPTSFKRSSASPTPELASSRTKRVSSSSNLKPTPEEVDKENYVPNPTSLDDLSTPKPSTTRRRVMIAA